MHRHRARRPERTRLPSVRLSIALAVALAGCAARSPVPVASSAHAEPFSPDEERALAAEYRRAASAYFAGDRSGAGEALERALAIDPSADDLVYQLAVLAARTGRTEEAYERLERLVAMHSTLVPQDDRFPGLSGERFERLKATLAANGPATHAEVAFTVPERDLMAEGIAHDAATGRLFVGSIRKRKVILVAPDGSSRDFVAPRGRGLLAPLGMKVDARRRRLWVASYAATEMEGFTQADRGRAALFCFDADSGKLVAVYPRETAGSHLFNDVALDARGDVYVTDSEAGEVLRLPAGAAPGDAFEVVVPAGELVYPNGLTLSPDGRVLYVADFVQGITLVRLGTGERSIVRHRRGVTTREIDGLYFQDGSLVAVQNGSGPGRVVRFALSADGTAIVDSELLEANHPRFATPTTGALVGDALYLVANSQLGSFGPDGLVWPPERLRPLQILRVPLRPRPTPLRAADGEGR